MSDPKRESFREFLERRQAAGRAFVTGDAAPGVALTSRGPQTTFFDPFGGYHQGGDTVCAVYTRNAGLFAKGEYAVEMLHVDADERLGYSVQIQRGEATLRGASEPMQVSLRVTEIFRREDGEWKLIHRHADPIK